MMDAAARDDGEQARRQGIHAALAAGTPHDLQASLRWLQEAAERGCRAAQVELAALVGNWRLAADLARGKALQQGAAERLRAAVDVAAWLRHSPGEPLSASPRMAMVRKFLSGEVCDWLVRLAKPWLRAATVVDAASGQFAEDIDRTNRSAEFGTEQADMVLAFVRSRIAALANVHPSALDWSQVLHYETGQQFRQHYDFFDTAIPAYAEEAARGGQRGLTVLVYLNDRYQGGETAFPRLGRAFKGRKGDALVFSNLHDDGTPDFSTLHAGTAPTEGEKWLFSQWIRVRPPAA